MSKEFSPIVSEFESAEQEASHDAWFRSEVEASLADDSPTTPHDQVMAEMDAIIAAAIQKRKIA
jgi:hypothetical protein